MGRVMPRAWAAILAAALYACTASGLELGSLFPQPATAWAGCQCQSSEDPELVGNLLAELSLSTEKFVSCRQQVLRQQYHVPLVIGNPLTSSNSLLWQALCGVLAVACAVSVVLTRRSTTAARKLQHREVLWRQAIMTVHAKAQERLQLREQAWQQQQAEWHHKEAAWQQGVQEVVQLVQLREAALTEQPPGGGAAAKVGRVQSPGSCWAGCWVLELLVASSHLPPPKALYTFVVFCVVQRIVATWCV
jgi:hypothetical protein